MRRRSDNPPIDSPYNERTRLFDAYAFKKYFLEQDPYKGEQLQTYLKRAIEEYCTPMQKAYIYEYFTNYTKYEDIGKKYGVSKGSVSRTIKRGMDNVIRCLSIYDPRFKVYIKKAKIMVNPRTKEKYAKNKHNWNHLHLPNERKQEQ